VSLDPQLVEILACPDSHHTPLDYDAAAQTLTCPQCRRVFEVRDGIPILLLDEAREPGAGESGAGESAAGAAAADDREGA
jgi:hypothetical protein